MTLRHSETLITAIPRSQSLAAPAPPASLEFSVMFPASQKKMCILISFYPPKPQDPKQHFWGVTHPFRQEHSLVWDALAFPANVAFTPSWARSHPFGGLWHRFASKGFFGFFLGLWKCRFCVNEGNKRMGIRKKS